MAVAFAILLKDWALGNLEQKLIFAIIYVENITFSCQRDGFSFSGGLKGH
jgi:hypothetical protein